MLLQVYIYVIRCTFRTLQTCRRLASFIEGSRRCLRSSQHVGLRLRRCHVALWLRGHGGVCQIKNTYSWMDAPTKQLVSLRMIERFFRNKPSIDSKFSFMPGIFEAEAARKSTFRKFASTKHV